MKVSIIIPSYNEAATLSQVVAKVLSLKTSHLIEVIIVDDGSTDRTSDILKKLSKNKNLKIITNKLNLGKGASIKKALKLATGQVVVIQDADLEYDPKDILLILEKFKDRKVEVVYGSRVLKKNPISHWTFNLGGRLLTQITNLLYRINITDEATGYKAFRKKVVTKINFKSKGFEFCPEITAKLAKRKITIWEVPISYSPRPPDLKKIKWQDGLLAIYYLFKYRFTD